MFSFTAFGVGVLARSPEVCSQGDTAYVKFCLVASDEVEDDKGKAIEISSAVWFAAFGEAGDAIIKHARKGDQLIVAGYIRPHTRIEESGGRVYDTTLVVTDYRFGAKRGDPGSAAHARSQPRPQPSEPGEEVAAVAEH